MIEKVISGGQTGVDRAALDAAIERGISYGGYVPRGRRAEDGRVPDCYNLVELDSPSYAERTAYNVSEARMVLLLSPTHAFRSPGTQLTARICRRQRKVCCWVFLEEDDLEHEASYLRSVFKHHHVNVLMVAGPRESGVPGIYHQAKAFLLELFKE